MNEETAVLTESKVIGYVCDFLTKHNFSIKQRLKETEKGIDIIATTPDGSSSVAIEAKGEGSARVGSRRYGAVFTGNQVYDHVAKAFYCAVIRPKEGMLSGLAFPDNTHHHKQVNAILHAVKALDIEIFWVQQDGSVAVEGASLWWQRHSK